MTNKEINKPYLILLLLLVQKLESKLLLSCDSKTKEQILQLVEKNRLQSIFYDFLKTNSLLDLFSNTQIKHLAFLSNFQIVNNIKNFKTVTKISKAFDKKINYAFLKGVALKVMNESANNRPIRDIDILVEEEQINEAIKVLEKMGFEQQYTHLTASEYDHRMLNKSGVLVEIHYRILKANHMQDCKLSSSILKNRVKKKLNFQDMYIPKLEDQMCHLIYHASTKDYFSSGPYIISDLKALLDFSELSTKDLIKFSKQYRLEKHAQIFFDLIDFICLNKKGNNITPKNIISLMPRLLLENNLESEDVFLLEIGNRQNRINIFSKKLRNEELLNKFVYIFFRLMRLLDTIRRKYFNSKFYSNYRDYKKVRDYLSS